MRSGSGKRGIGSVLDTKKENEAEMKKMGVMNQPRSVHETMSQGCGEDEC